MNFFILGLPRSRTAWLSTFMNVCGSFCYHEGINGCRSMDEYKTKLGNNKGDSLTGGTIVNLEAIFPEAPIVVVDSDPERAIDYTYKTYGNYIPDFFYKMKENLNNISGFHVNLEDIDDRLEEIWIYLTGKEYPRERAELVQKMTIQVKDPYDVDEDAIMELLNAN